MDFLVTNQAMKARYALPTIASDSVKFTSLTFYFDSSWDGLTKTAYFHQDGLDTPIASLLDSSGTCYLPNSLTAGKAWVGLSGHSSDGETIGTTNKVMLVIHQSAYDDDAQAEVDPSPSLYAELLAQFEVYVGEAEGYAGDAESSASSASGSATSASSSASSASTSATNAATSETNAGISATNASASATNASTSATNADTSATSAETSRQAIENMAVEASTGAAYSVATVTKTTDDGVVTLTFVIPKGDTGAPFYIAKTYSSVLEMNADYDGTDVEVNEFVLISTSSVEDEDNAKVYVKTDTSYQFVTDLSGAQGIQGQTGNGIASITLTSTVGLVKTYTILFTDSTTTTFSVTDGEKGDAFTTEITYTSVSAMNAGYSTDGVAIGGYVIISTSDTSDPDYGKVYQKGATEYEYIITMAGVKGDTGASAYEVAVENGFSGTESEWLVSLVGADGTDGTNGTDGIDGQDGTNGTNGQDGLTTSITLNGDEYTVDDDGNIDLGDVGGGAFDLVIRTQAEFEAMYASDTWLDAKSVCFVGDGGTTAFTRSDGMGLKIPQTVMNLQGVNDAKISVTNFSLDAVTNFGALWYETQPEVDAGYWIDGLSVECTGEQFVTGFFHCTQLTNCTGTGTGNSKGYGFHTCTQLTNCTGTGTGTGTSSSYGFFNCTQLTNCTGTGTGNNNSYGFYHCTQLTNCTGTGTGNSNGYGFYTCAQLTNCTGTGTGNSNACGFSYCTQLTNCTGTGTGTGTGLGYGFHTCTQLTNCTGTGTGTVLGFGFFDCKWVNGCKQGNEASTTALTGGTMLYVDESTVVAS